MEGWADGHQTNQKKRKQQTMKTIKNKHEAIMELVNHRIFEEKW
jgi:hypothetical protein